MSDQTPKRTNALELTEKLEALLQRARRGDQTTLPAIREFLDAHPEYWREACDLGRFTLGHWTSLVAGQDLVLSESLKRQFEEKRDEVAGPSPTPSEGLLADRVALTWLMLHHAELLFAEKQQQKLSLSQLKYFQCRQERAQQMHLQAMKMLAVVRRLTPARSTQDEGKPEFSDEALTPCAVRDAQDVDEPGEGLESGSSSGLKARTTAKRPLRNRVRGARAVVEVRRSRCMPKS